MSGSTNSKIKNQNKQVKKQHKYDKEYWKYQNYDNERKYNDAKLRTELRQAQADNQAQYRDEINLQQYGYQNALNNLQFDNERRAYQQSLKDYDSQVELNSMSGALAQEAADRKLDEQLISRNFDLKDLEIGYKKDVNQKNFDIGKLKRDVKFAKKQLALDKDKGEFKYIKQQAARDLAQNSLRNAQLNNDIKFLGTKANFDLARADLAFSEAKTQNYEQRIESLVESKREVGSIRAAGREGASAEATVDSALAEYGREQSSLVRDLVFSKKKTSLDKGEIKATRNSQIKGKQLDKKLNSVERKKIQGKRDRDLFVKKLQNNKLDLAFNQLKANALSETQKIKKDFGLKTQEFKQSKKKVNTSFTSAKLQYKADTKKIRLDQYASNLAAQGKVLLKPKAPPKLPVPIKTPRVKLPMPLKPITPPEPIKGALGKTSIWNDIGDGLNVGLSIAGLFI